MEGITAFMSKVRLKLSMYPEHRFETWTEASAIEKGGCLVVTRKHTTSNEFVAAP